MAIYIEFSDLKIVMFHGYVTLPECNSSIFDMPWLPLCPFTLGFYADLYPLVNQHNSPCLMGKSITSGPFSIAILVYQRVVDFLIIFALKPPLIAGSPACHGLPISAQELGVGTGTLAALAVGRPIP